MKTEVSHRAEAKAKPDAFESLSLALPLTE